MRLIWNITFVRKVEDLIYDSGNGKIGYNFKICVYK